jgi:hypothetical protein
MYPFKHKVRVENAKFRFWNKSLFDIELQGYEGKEIFVTLSEAKRSRSLNQNRYYWGVVLKILGNEFGYSVDEMHDILKQKFLENKEVEFNGESFKVYKSTTSLTTKEFEEYTANIRRWAAELSVQVPEPNEV